MRFMEWSKSNFPVRLAVLALVCAFVASLGVVGFPDEAQAGRKNVWSVKFKCSDESDDLVDLIPTLDTSENFFLQTIVNIHNPTEQTIQFNKKAVIALRQNQIPGDDPTDFVSDKDGETLGPNEALALDCLDIRDLFANSKPAIDVTNTIAVHDLLEGYVVIESETGRKIPDLAVCANYIMASVRGAQEGGDEPTGASLHVQCYDPFRVKFRGKFKPF